MTFTAHDLAASRSAMALAEIAFQTLPSPVVAGIRGFRPETSECAGIGLGDGPVFGAGVIVITAQADAVLRNAGASLDELLVRYVCGDWAGFWESRALDDAGTIYATFECGGHRLAMLTTADRARTTVTTPAEYRTTCIPH